MPFAIPDRANCTYTKCYCEENVWMLCKSIEKSGDEDLLLRTSVLFVSNPTKTVPIWKQSASKRKDTMVIWDYHVVLFIEDRRQIYDLDSMLPFPCSLAEYAKEALMCGLDLKPEYQHMLRVVPAARFLKIFASDRSHMKKEDGSWLAEPPAYPPISSEESKNNLQRFLDMLDASDLKYGELYTLNKFLGKFK